MEGGLRERVHVTVIRSMFTLHVLHIAIAIHMHAYIPCQCTVAMQSSNPYSVGNTL